MFRAFVVLLTLSSFTAFSQVNVRDSTTQGWLIHISASYLTKGGDFASYLGENFALGGDVQYKFKSNWLVSVGGRYHFADDLQNAEEIFGDLLTARGEVISLNGEYAPITFRERGWNLSADVGYIFNQFGHNANSGLLVSLGAGYNVHFIDIRNQRENTPQVQELYKRGYDRRNEGIMTRQLIAYQFAGSERRINFTIGFEFMQGFNENVRGFNYDTREYVTGTHVDLYYGLRFSWFLPIYDENAQKFYYY